MDEAIKLEGLRWIKTLPEAALLEAKAYGTQECLEQLARSLRIQLPRRYGNLAHVVQGYHPSKSAFIIWEISEASGNEAPQVGQGLAREIECFAIVALEKKSPWQASTIRTQMDLLAEGNSGLFPFAFDVRGNVLCLDYGETWEDPEPCVVYYDRARAPGDEVFPVAAEFGTFLDKLFDNVRRKVVFEPDEDTLL